MRRTLGTAVMHALYALGILQLLARVMLRRRAVVVTYHRVLGPADRARTWSHPAIVVASDTFERQMRALKQYFRVLTPDGFERFMAQGAFEPRSCLVTFDDGWFDTYDEAWPILKRTGVPAIVFLPSAFVGTGEVFWQERVGHILHVIWLRVRQDPAAAEQMRPALARFGLDSVLQLGPDDMRAGILQAVRRLKASDGLDPTAVVSALLAVAPEAERGCPSDRFMTWDQVREMAADGIAFGAHGDTHRRLTTLPDATVEREVDTSRRIIEQALGRRVTAFCYPNGDWSPSVAAVVADHSFSLAFSTEPGHIESGANRFALRRVNIHEDMTGSVPLFLGRILGLI